ncbi:hypothetical protein F5887DRAFT_917169 [Amanita rubescens]|nr:hypothetical protein F5887DRAFT_917169 [Amanita rubescens]
MLFTTLKFYAILVLLLFVPTTVVRAAGEENKGGAATDVTAQAPTRKPDRKLPSSRDPCHSLCIGGKIKKYRGTMTFGSDEYNGCLKECRRLKRLPFKTKATVADTIRSICSKRCQTGEFDGTEYQENSADHRAFLQGKARHSNREENTEPSDA